jgi:hypothetical protein
MKTGDKVATVLFWIVAGALAVIVAGDNFRIGVEYFKPWRIVAGLALCIVAAFGVRECANSIKRAKPTNDAV